MNLRRSTRGALKFSAGLAIGRGRSDVLFQVIFARSISTTFLYAVFREVEALIGGGEALRRRCSCSDALVGYRMSVCSSRGCPCLTAGVGAYAGHKASVGHSPAMVLAPAYECVVKRRSAILQLACCVGRCPT